MSFAVRTEGLGKKYLIGHQRQERYETFRDMLMHKARGIGQRFRHPLSPNAEDIELEELWALRGVDLEIRRGEKVGIIGRNGAGKTTLLKLLSRITEPSEGRFTINGRVSSLLEVGTGFHPELTGRENIFLNGAILGMSRTEIKSRFDEIVDFAEVERFLDTPVKRYSSGMYVRLAFAVAAHLEPEILIVDEVLAVGDAAFQKKCLGKMGEVAGSGRTVLFVSHNMAAIESLCSSCYILKQGRVGPPTSPRKAIADYAISNDESLGLDISLRSDRQGEGDIKLLAVTLHNQKGDLVDSIPAGEPMHICLKYRASRSCRHLRVIIGVYDSMNVGVLRFDTNLGGAELELPAGVGTIECRTEAIPASPGEFSFNVALLDGGVMQDYVQRVRSFSIISSDYFGNGRFITQQDAALMRVLVRHRWSVDAEAT